MVEWKKLGEVCSLERGVRVVRKDLQEIGHIPVFQNSLTPLGYFEKSNYPAHTAFVICAGAAGEVGFSDVPFWAADDCTCVICNPYMVSKYTYYYLLVKQHVLKSQVRKASVPRLSKTVIEKIKIPIPSLEEQNRIVGILDTFTDSIENLKLQIAQRRKQYEHYRDQLLDLEGKEGVEMKTLGEIGKCCAGATPSTKNDEYWNNGNIPWMSSGEVHQGVVRQTAKLITQLGFDNCSTKWLPSNTVVIALAGQGKTRGTVAITAIELCTNQSICGIIINRNDINNKYIYYYLRTRYNDLRRVSSGDGTRGGLNLKMIESYKFPYISFEKQNKIVSILDTFEASISNLEAQLAQRQKQYEYYRNQLLTFE